MCFHFHASPGDCNEGGQFSGKSYHVCTATRGLYALKSTLLDPLLTPIVLP